MILQKTGWMAYSSNYNVAGDHYRLQPAKGKAGEIVKLKINDQTLRYIIII